LENQELANRKRAERSSMERDIFENKLYPLNMRDDDTKSLTYERKREKQKQKEQYEMLKAQ